nr:hypothetical protein Iba_scaffold6462CG0180 [Ipomoea batatas]
MRPRRAPPLPLLPDEDRRKKGAALRTGEASVATAPTRRRRREGRREGKTPLLPPTMVTHRRRQPQLSPRPSLSTREVSMPHVETGGGTRIVAADDGETTSPTSPEMLTAGVFLCCCCEPNGMVDNVIAELGRRSPPRVPPAHAVDAPSSSHACCDERHALPCSKPPPPIVALPLKEEGDAGRKPLAGVGHCRLLAGSVARKRRGPIIIVSRSSQQRETKIASYAPPAAVITPSAIPDQAIEQPQSGAGAAWRRRRSNEVVGNSTSPPPFFFLLCSTNVRRPFLSRRHQILLAVDSNNPSPASPGKEGSRTSPGTQSRRRRLSLSQCRDRRGRVLAVATAVADRMIRHPNHHHRRPVGGSIIAGDRSDTDRF